jgi:hypothetical protein
MRDVSGRRDHWSLRNWPGGEDERGDEERGQQERSDHNGDRQAGHR